MCVFEFHVFQCMTEADDIVTILLNSYLIFVVSSCGPGPEKIFSAIKEKIYEQFYEM